MTDLRSTHDSDDDQHGAPPTSAPSPGPRLGPAVGAVKVDNLGSTIGRVIRHMSGERLTAIIIVIIAVGGAALAAIGPWLLGRATDVVVSGMMQQFSVDQTRLTQFLIGATIAYIAAAGFGVAQSYLLTGMVHRSMFRLRADVEAKIHRLPLRRVDGQARGDLLSRATNDIDNFSQSLQQTLNQFLSSVMLILGVAVAMVIISPVLALVALSTVPLSYVLVRVVTKRSRPLFGRQWRSTGEVNAQIEESIHGHTLIRVFGQQHQAQQRFDRSNQALLDSSFRAQFVSGLVQPSMIFLSNMNFVLIAVVGGARVASNALTLGQLQAFIQYSRLFTQPLNQMASILNVFQSGMASAERVFELLDEQEESPDPQPARPPSSDPRLTQENGVERSDQATAGRVVFDNISFRYVPHTPLIEGVSLVAEPGSMVAIVGPTGAGKTTLVNLLMRFYEVDDGAITIDGQDIASMARGELRSKIGMVLQDTWLFTGTIWDNLRYGRPDATDEEILAAARTTSVDRFVQQLPDGYHTIIDEETGTLSAGERQLLTIARALLADPAILILDEATSSIDSRTEIVVQQAMAALRQDRTSFVIAHRLSTIRSADVIMVMDQGAVVEHGSHDELLAADGFYAQLYHNAYGSPAAPSEPSG